MDNNSKKFVVTKGIAIIGALGFLACITSFALALKNDSFLAGIVALWAALYCLNHVVLYFKADKKS